MILAEAVANIKLRLVNEILPLALAGWEVELAQKYYRKLFREYAVGDLSRYKVSFSFAMPRISEHDSIIVFYE